MSLKIEAFFERNSEQGKKWEPLPKTSQYLTEKQLVPNVGDALTLAGDDGISIGLEPTSLEHIMSVKIKWLNYATSDVAVVLHYVPF